MPSGIAVAHMFPVPGSRVAILDHFEGTIGRPWWRRKEECGNRGMLRTLLMTSSRGDAANAIRERHNLYTVLTAVIITLTHRICNPFHAKISCV